jgi:hypothetical protein
MTYFSLDILMNIRYYPRRFANLARFCFRLVLFITTGGKVKDPSRTKQELTEEISILKQRFQELEKEEKTAQRQHT